MDGAVAAARGGGAGGYIPELGHVLRRHQVVTTSLEPADRAAKLSHPAKPLAVAWLVNS